MTDMDFEFTIKMAITFVLSGVIFYFMEKAQQRKQAEADRKFEETMRMIELRNRKVNPNENDRIRPGDESAE